MTAAEKYGGRGLDGMATVLCPRVPRPCEVGLFRRPDAPAAATSAHTLRAPLGSPTLETCSKWVQSKVSFLDIHVLRSTCKSSVCQHSARAQLLNARNYRRPTCTAKGPKSPGLLMGDLISRANGKKNISIANGVIHIH